MDKNDSLYWMNYDFIAIGRDGKMIACGDSYDKTENMAHRNGEPRPVVIRTSTVMFKDGMFYKR